MGGPATTSSAFCSPCLLVWVGVMEADVLPSADKRYVHKEDKKHFLKVLQHAAVFGHPSLITGPAAVVTAACGVGSCMVGSRPEVNGGCGSCMPRCVLLACGAGTVL